MKKKALIFGITGQDGSYLAEFLIKKRYVVHGVKRKSSSLNTSRIDHLYDNGKSNSFYLHYGDLADSLSIQKIINDVKPNEIYNLAAQSHVAVSFELPEYTSDINAIGTLRILECIKFLGLEKKVKFYQAGTSEMFGKVLEVPQSEKTPFHPRSVYGISKVAGYDLTRNYREAYNMFCCNGILFNHESPRRGFEFVTRKITHSVARIKFGLQKELRLGNLDAKRDWGHAKDYVEAMWLMLNQRKPKDYVISTGKQYSVKEFAKLAFELVDLDYKKYVKIEKNLFRPSEVKTLLGNCNKAKKELKWKPKYNFKELVKDMVKSDLEFVQKEGY